MLLPSRVVGVRATVEATGEQLTAFGVYMPNRGGGGEELQETWDLLDDAVAVEARVLVGGDFNAEPREWVEKRGAEMKDGDKRFEEIRKERGMAPVLLAGATYRSGTLIDNWLASNECVSRFGKATILPGVCGKDHEIVCAPYCYGGSDVENRTERPTSGHTKHLSEKGWEKYVTEVGEAVEAAIEECKQAGGAPKEQLDPPR